MCRGSSTIGFAPNPLLFDAPTCRLLSFPSRLGCSRSVSRTPTCVFRSFPCGIESFPYGIKSFPHGNDLRQVLAKSIHCSDIRFSYVVWPRSHMVLSHSHMVLSSHGKLDGFCPRPERHRSDLPAIFCGSKT